MITGSSLNVSEIRSDSLESTGEKTGHEKEAAVPPLRNAIIYLSAMM